MIFSGVMVVCRTLAVLFFSFEKKIACECRFAWRNSLPCTAFLSHTQRGSGCSFYGVFFCGLPFACVEFVFIMLCLTRRRLLYLANHTSKWKKKESGTLFAIVRMHSDTHIRHIPPLPIPRRFLHANAQWLRLFRAACQHDLIFIPNVPEILSPPTLPSLPIRWKNGNVRHPSSAIL